MGRNRVDQTSAIFFSFNKEGENLWQGTRVANESLAGEHGLSGDTFMRSKADNGSLG